MYSQSDTESDSGASQVYASELPPFIQSEPSAAPCAEKCEMTFFDAAKYAFFVSQPTLTLCKTSQEVLSCASAIISRFLDDVHAINPDASESRAILTSAMELFDDAFMTSLFVLRRHFHQFALQNPPPRDSLVVVCWADSLIVKISNFSVAAASGLTSLHISGMPQSLDAQRQDDSLRGAAQLPCHDWEQIPEVLSSPATSAAAKRVALHLLLGTFILRPQLTQCNPWTERLIHPLSMLECVSRSLTQIDLHRPLLACLSSQERISHSILVALYVSASMAASDGTKMSPWKPRTISSILEIIQSVILSHGYTIEAPDASLDVSQKIILRWSRIVPWSWMVWRDQRTAGSESIASLTSVWLTSVDQPLFGTSHNSPSNEWKDGFVAQVDLFPSASLSMMIRILQTHLNTGELEKPLLAAPTTIYRCCLALLHLIKRRLHASQDVPSEIYTYFLRLFVSLGNHTPDIETKVLILDALSVAGESTWTSGITAIQGSKNRFSAKLDDLIILTRRRVAHNVISLFSSDGAEVTTLIAFLGILWHKGHHETIHRQTVTPFLHTLISKLAAAPPQLASHFASDTLITTLAIFELPDLNGPLIDTDAYWEDETIWGISIAAGNSITIASSLSHYIIASKRLCPTITCLEAWDLLRDTLLLVLTRQYLHDEEPIALISAPALCQALAYILLSGDSGSNARLYLSSPWTLNINNELESLLSKEPTGQYDTVLKERVAESGRFLLEVIHSKGKGHSTAKLPVKQNKIIFSEVHGVSRLLLMPEL
ncbi:hypothetical protein ONZ45_g18770 [Pleurotus djamor]|nr:hypothetical protein ONZ45_g18770 [Pleurotus djamor]